MSSSDGHDNDRWEGESLTSSHFVSVKQSDGKMLHLHLDSSRHFENDLQLSPTPIGYKTIPLCGRRKDEDEISHAGSYGSHDSRSQTIEKVPNSTNSELDPKGGQDRSNLQKQLYDATKLLVSEGEKNVSLALDLEKYKDELSTLKMETDAFRSVLLRGINGGVADSNNYTHVGLDELLRLRIQESLSVQSSLSGDASLQPQQFGLARNESSVGVIQQLEQKLGMEAQQNEALEAKCLSLKDELEASAKNMEGVESLRSKVSQMVQRLRTEREVKFKVQKELSIEKNKVAALSDHIEKLMVHLKHEAIAKARSLADQSRQQREMEVMRTRSAAISKKNERKDQVIAELREGGKLLEDQLRLMDEKYMELRTKLDWTRSQTERIVKKKDDEVRQMRLKFEMLSDKQMLLGNSDEENSIAKKQKPRVSSTLQGCDMEGRRSVVELNKALRRAMKKEGARHSRTR